MCKAQLFKASRALPGGDLTTINQERVYELCSYANLGNQVVEELSGACPRDDARELSLIHI